jgi:hypothetical protein
MGSSLVADLLIWRSVHVVDDALGASRFGREFRGFFRGTRHERYSALINPMKA